MLYYSRGYNYRSTCKREKHFTMLWTSLIFKISPQFLIEQYTWTLIKFVIDPRLWVILYEYHKCIPLTYQQPLCHVSHWIEVRLHFYTNKLVWQFSCCHPWQALFCSPCYHKHDLHPIEKKNITKRLCRKYSNFNISVR